jgi:hypothetical protein
MASRFPADGMDGSLSGSWVGAKKIVSREEKTRSGREKSNMCTTYKNGDLEDGCLPTLLQMVHLGTKSLKNP